MIFAFLGLALLSLSSSPIWLRLAAAPNLAIGTHRLLGAALVLLIWQLIRKKSPFKLLEKRHADVFKWTCISGLFFFVHLWTYTASAQSTSVAHLVMIFAANPIFTALGALIFFQQKLEKRILIAYPLAMLGLFLLFLDRPQNTEVSFAGDVWALISAALHSGYALTGKRVRRELDNVVFSFWMYLVAGVCFGICYLFSPPPLLPLGGTFYASILALIVFPSLLGHTLFTYLLRHMNINVLSCAKLAEPSLAAIMAYFVFGEQVGSLAIMAFIMIASAVTLILLPRTSKVVRNLEA